MADGVLQMHMTGTQQSRFIFLGMRSNFSSRVFEGLLQADTKPAAVWVAAGRNRNDPAIRLLVPESGRSALPVLNGFLVQDITHVAWQHGIPVYEVSELSSPETLDLLGRLNVAVGTVACFPRRLPPELLEIPEFGFLNLHPSLLPQFRGPYPLFWTFRSGIRETGITLHRIDNGLDTGDVVSQSSIILPDGIGSQQADALFADQGAKLLRRALPKFASGDVVSRPQSEGGSYQGRPTRDDFTIPTSWPARRAFNFMKGTAEWNHPYAIEGKGFQLMAHSALAFGRECASDELLVRRGRKARVAFTPGWVQVKTL